MRNDPLVASEKPQFRYGPLPGEIRDAVVPIEAQLFDEQAELVEWILGSESEEQFNTRLTEFKPIFNSIVLKERIDLFGIYESGPKKITVDKVKISRYAQDYRSAGLNISDEDLIKLVEIHEEQHALHHLAQDGRKNNAIWDEFAFTPSYLLESLAQLFAYDLCRSNKNLEYAFVELEKRQPTEYKLWRVFRNPSKESIYWMIREEPRRIVKILERLGFDLPPESISKKGIGKIAGEIYNDREGNIHGEVLPDVVRKRYPYPANCYPGKPGKECFQTAFFFSLTARRYANPDKGHMSFRQMLGCLVRHMKGICGRTTKQVFIFSDNWEADAYDEWKPVIDEFRNTTALDVCLIAGADHYWFRI